MLLMEYSADINQLFISVVSSFLRKNNCTGFDWFQLGFSLSSATFSQDAFPSVVSTARGPSVTKESLASVIKGFHCLWKPDRLVCLQHCLITAPPCSSTCHVPFRCFHSDWSTGLLTSWWNAFLCLCHASDPDITATMSSCHIDQ